MNHCVPDWSMDDDLRAFNDLFPQSNEKKSMPSDNELVELLWRNGHVVMQSQTNRKPPPPSVGEIRQSQKPNPQPKPIAPLVNLIPEDDLATWFHYPLEDSLEFLSEMPVSDTIDPNKPSKQVIIEEDVNAFTMPPPKSHVGGGPVIFSHFLRPAKADMGGSLKTGSSSVCGSNQVQNLNDRVPGKGLKEAGPMISPREWVGASMFDTTVTSSSGGSGCSFRRTTTRQQGAGNLKRKGRDGEESECHSEEAEYESIEANRLTQRPSSTRKSRAAEVHNLSERRRRDRINEKMRALQELIPHCNKSDKASMLDEAIGYLKSLQLQLQLMWMGSGMTPMMFPGMQQYMPRVVNNPIQLSRNPLAMQNAHLPESYARYFGGFPHMQLPPQAMNLYTYGSHMVQQNQTASSSLLTAVIPSENVQNGPSGSY